VFRLTAATLMLAVLPGAVAGQARPPADSAALAALLASVRGANPVLCELAARTVDNQSGWGWGGGIGATSLRASRDPAVRPVLMAINQERSPVSAVPLLGAALIDEDACVRRIAAPLLGRVDHPSALTALRQALRDDRPATREVAAIGLGFTGNPSVIPALLAGLQDSVARVRVACALALGELDDHRAIGALTRLLREDRDEDVRAAAAWAIGEIEG
jgi:HEAT repeat protein